MSRVNYDSVRLIPAPFVEFTKTYQTTEDGEKIGSLWQISINGKLCADKGSPNSSGVFWSLSGYPPDENISEDSRLGALLRKETALRQLFSNDGKSLEWQSEDGTSPMKTNPRIKEINFARDLWYNTVDYTINAEADVLYMGTGPLDDTFEFDGYIESASESWQIETDESQPVEVGTPRTYRLTHTLTAKGKRFYNDSAALEAPAWQQARDWVTPRLGLDASYLTSQGVRDMSGVSGYNYITSENIDEVGGTYSVTESWVLSTESALETFDISVRTAASTGLTTVTIDGSVTGLETRHNTTMALSNTKYENAVTKFSSVSSSALSRAQSYSGTTLNITPLSSTVGRNPVTGVITYSYEYDNRASNLITTALSEVISINDSLGTDVVAIIPVMGRTAGPVLQNMGTSKEKRRTLDIEIVVSPTVYGDTLSLFGNKPDQSTGTIASIITAANPTSTGASSVYLDENQERWEPREGRYSLTKVWIYEL